MTKQSNFFKVSSDEQQTVPKLPEGLRYEPQLIDQRDENRLLQRVRKLPFKEFEFHGYLGKRRVVSFGWQYEFSGAGRVRKADDIPDFLLPLRMGAAAFANLKPDALQHVLVIEYAVGAGIGWHRDKPVFGEVVGVSLLAPALIRFRRQTSKAEMIKSGKGKQVRTKAKWERFNLPAEPRSAYHLSGPARSEWQHSISGVDALRYSITFRSMLQ